MRELRSGTLTVQAYDKDVYMQEHNLLRVRDTQVGQVGVAFGDISSVLAHYSLDDAGECVIDMSDLIRTRAAGDVFIFNRNGMRVQSVKADFQVVGLINPYSLLVPKTESGAAIECPPMMYRQCFAGEANRVSFELQATKTDTLYLEYRNDELLDFVDVDAGTGGAYGNGMEGTTDVVLRVAMTDPPSHNDEQGTGGEADISAGIGGVFRVAAKFHLIDTDPCKRYATVRWFSATGRVRTHVFEVRDVEQSVGESVDLLTIDGSYNRAKGRVDGFKLYLDNLTPYDCWYYGDIVTSTRVEVSLDGVTFDQVDITTKSVTIPNGGSTNKLEVNVNWRKYDAIAL